jgi:predicted esterase
MKARGALQWLSGFSLGLLALTGCGSSGSEVIDTSTGGPAGPSGSGVTSSVTSGGGGAGGTGSSSGGSGGSNVSGITCKSTPPPGAELAPDPPIYSGGECPELASGFNTITSMGNSREFMLVLPENFDSSEDLPVIFLWHWLGGSAQDFFERGQVQEAVNTQRFIAVIPESKDDIQFKWPFEVTANQARVDEEFTFFDDMLSCVSKQFNVNNNCVASAGVSAGALFTDQLAGGRGQYLSSIISLSGGVGGVVREWTAPEHKMPAVVLWGGPTDQCFFVLNFETASKSLETGLESGNHFFLECVHNCGHAEPPLEAPMGQTNFAGLWQFVFDHPYWLKAGESPYKMDGIPKVLPSWCGIGAASATPRTGECPNPPGC